MLDISTNAVPEGIYTVWLEGQADAIYYQTRRQPVSVRIGAVPRRFSLNGSVLDGATETLGGTITLPLKVVTGTRRVGMGQRDGDGNTRLAVVGSRLTDRLQPQSDAARHRQHLLQLAQRDPHLRRRDDLDAHHPGRQPGIGLLPLPPARPGRQRRRSAGRPDPARPVHGGGDERTERVRRRHRLLGLRDHRHLHPTASAAGPSPASTRIPTTSHCAWPSGRASSPGIEMTQPAKERTHAVELEYSSQNSRRSKIYIGVGIIVALLVAATVFIALQASGLTGRARGRDADGRRGGQRHRLPASRSPRPTSPLASWPPIPTNVNAFESVDAGGRPGDRRRHHRRGAHQSRTSSPRRPRG